MASRIFLPVNTILSVLTGKSSKSPIPVVSRELAIPNAFCEANVYEST
jgi:hypothetical protein